MNRQNTVLIKQFPEHTQKTVHEIINMLFTWNGKEKSKLAGQKTWSQHSKAALMVRHKTVMLCILETWRPWDLPAVLQTQRKGLYPPQRAQTAQDIRTWRDTWRSCRWLAPRRVPGMSVSSLGVRLLRTTAQIEVRTAREGKTQTPHTLYTQLLKQPQLLQASISSRAWFPPCFAKCTQCALHSK